MNAKEDNQVRLLASERMLLFMSTFISKDMSFSHVVNNFLFPLLLSREHVLHYTTDLP